MNATDTHQPANRGISAAESQLMHSSLMMLAQARGDEAMNGPPALTATPTMAGLWRALQRRWRLGLGVAAGATILAILAVFVFMPPKYNVQTRLRVVAKQGGPEDVEFAIFKASMEALVRDQLVINAALNSRGSNGREIKDLGIVREQGMAISEWLEKNLKTDYLLGPEVLRITLAADNPEEAAELLNAVAGAFVNRYAETERSNRQQKLDELRRQKDAAEDDLRKLRITLGKQMDALSIKDRELMTVQQSVWINRLHATAGSQRINEDELARAEGKILAADAKLKTLDRHQIPDELLYELFSRDQIIQSFDRRIVEIEGEITAIFQKFNPPFSEQYAKPLTEEKEKVNKLKSDREALLKPDLEVRWRKNERIGLEHQMAIADEEVKSCKRRRESLAKEIAELERNVKESGPGGANRPPQIQATDDKIKQKEQAVEFTAKKISEAEVEVPQPRVVSILPAAKPLDKDRTQQTKIAGAGGLGIFVMALFGVAFFEFRTRKISIADEVTRGLGMKVVGTMPARPTRSKKPTAKDATAEAQWLGRLNESVDAIRTVLLHQARSQAMHVVMVTSASGGEGKTTLATQLAASLSRAWKRVLLVDADLRHPGAHTLFDVPHEPGLAELLRGEAEMNDAIRATAHSRLWLMPDGNGDAHAIQALAQDNVRTLLEQLKQQYDFIIIDTPPVLPVTDGLLVGQHVDGLLFAILAGVSRAPEVYAAQQKLAPLNVPTLGAVVLGTESAGERSYQYATTLAGKP